MRYEGKLRKGTKKMQGGDYDGYLDENEKACGEGTLTFDDGTTTYGYWHEDETHGYRVLTTPDGTRWIGECKEYMWSGKLTVYSQDGSIYNYIWDKNEHQEFEVEAKDAWF